MSVWRDLFAGIGNESFDLARALWAIGVLSMIAFMGVAVGVKGQTFDPIAYGTGFAAILAAGGAAVKLKDSEINKAKATAKDTTNA